MAAPRLIASAAGADYDGNDNNHGVDAAVLDSSGEARRKPDNGRTVAAFQRSVHDRDRSAIVSWPASAANNRPACSAAAGVDLDDQAVYGAADCQHRDLSMKGIDVRPTIRLILAIAVVICGIFVLVKSAGNQAAVATGIGLILAGIEGIAP